MSVAQISYANTEPFFHFWPQSEFPLRPGVPKELAEAARRGEVIAGPLPLVETWKLEDQFMPLGPWGIAARERSRSVFVLSRIPFAELDQVNLGVTTESATSVILCETLIQQKYGHKVNVRRGLHMDDAAWLVIGDQALQLLVSPTRTWTVATDLATEWWQWKQMPFVFARWVVRRDLEPAKIERLQHCVQTSLSRGLRSLPQLAMKVSSKLGLPPVHMETYLQGLVYELDAEAEKSIHTFRTLAEPKGVIHVA